MSTESSSTSGKLPRRRNGKEQACEPCRKAKMRCDHGLPVCQNCRRRNLVDRCQYVEAPQTRPKAPRTGGPVVSPQSFNSPQTNLFSESPRLPTISSEVTTVSQEHNHGSKGGGFGLKSGFYGPTSFGAVFRDNEDDIGPIIDTAADQCFMQDFPDNNDRVLEHMGSRTALGVKLLNLLPNQTTCDRLYEIYAIGNTGQGFHKQTMIHCMSSLWSTFGQALRLPRKSKDLKDLTEILSRNTMSVIRYTDDGDTWLAQLSGRNLRWEMMGLIVSTLGFVLLALPEDDQFWATQSGSRMSRRDFALEMKECTDICVKLSNQMDNINTLMVSLLFRRTILESQCTGDTSLMLWRSQGDLSAAATGLGLHRDRYDNSPPSITTEMRRRTWATVFSIDKTISAFTGRPPSLSHRYNMCPLPLDIDDEVLLASQEERIHAVSLLDSNGWNTSGELTSATWSRAVMMQSLVLSEILEISLGSEHQYSIERVNELKFRNEQTHQSLPGWLHLSKNDPPSSISLHWTRFTLRLRYLHCALLLEQLSIRQAPANQQHMLDVAREMLELTVYMWIERDRFNERHYDYDWMIMCYGIPASGVICVELLKQTKEPRNTHLVLPRSEVIQNLSMLVGFLEWVRPTAANRELCGKMSAVIKRILDQVLEPPVNTGPNAPPDMLAPLAEYDFGQMDTGDFDWLGTVDWTQGPFVDLGTDGFNNFHDGSYEL